MEASSKPAQQPDLLSLRLFAALRLLNDGPARDRYIAACQIGITLSSLLAGAYAQAAIALPLAGLLACLSRRSLR